MQKAAFSYHFQDTAQPEIIKKKRRPEIYLPAPLNEWKNCADKRII